MSELEPNDFTDKDVSKEGIASQELKLFDNDRFNLELKTKLLKGTDSLIERVAETQPKMILFLDKSARPLSWLFVERWHAKKMGKLPPINYINFGREHHERINDLMNLQPKEHYDEIKPERLRAVPDKLFEKAFEEELQGIRKYVSEQSDKSKFDGEMLVIDDFSSTNKTKIALQRLLETALPACRTDWVNFFSPKNFHYHHYKKISDFDYEFLDKTTRNFYRYSDYLYREYIIGGKGVTDPVSQAEQLTARSFSAETRNELSTIYGSENSKLEIFDENAERSRLVRRQMKLLANEELVE